MRAAVVVPGVPALLRARASLQDPVAEMRGACAQAVADLVASDPQRVCVLGDPASPADLARGVEPLAGRLARELLADAGYGGTVVDGADTVRDEDALLVVANGSARRGEKAPGHLDERSFAFDDAIEQALRAGDAATLVALDVGLGDELLASGIAALVQLGTLMPRPERVTTYFLGDPYGVRYWVMGWR